ncbi:hypothetical protein ACIQB5_33375 [Streptomyces sp. NPDC088560]|uniref:hypothetical protein n=1 Tax=Streptomyces sp. NPDC088560 TaxID=3365868 RepID=UPI00381694BC
MSAELPGEVGLFHAPRDHHGPEARRRELHSEMAEVAEAENRDHVAGPSGAVPQAVDDGDACAGHKRLSGM